MNNKSLRSRCKQTKIYKIIDLHNKNPEASFDNEDSKLFDPEHLALAQSMQIDYKKARMSKNFVYWDAEMRDDDCSEDYKNELIFQQSGLAYFEQMQDWGFHKLGMP